MMGHSYAIYACSGTFQRFKDTWKNKFENKKISSIWENTQFFTQNLASVKVIAASSSNG